MKNIRILIEKKKHKLCVKHCLKTNKTFKFTSLAIINNDVLFCWANKPVNTKKLPYIDTSVPYKSMLTPEQKQMQ